MKVEIETEQDNYGRCEWFSCVYLSQKHQDRIDLGAFRGDTKQAAITEAKKFLAQVARATRRFDK